MILLSQPNPKETMKNGWRYIHARAPPANPPFNVILVVFISRAPTATTNSVGYVWMLGKSMGAKLAGFLVATLTMKSLHNSNCEL